MDTATDIANYALTIIGAGSVSDINSSERGAQLCNLHLRAALDFTLAKGAFPQVIARELLVSFGSPLDDWVFSFALPVSMIEPIELTSGASWAIEGGLFFTNDPAPVLRFISRPDRFGPLPEILCEAIGCRLASLVSYELTGDVGKVQLAESRFVVSLADAKAGAGRTKGNPAPKARLWGAR